MNSPEPTLVDLTMSQAALWFGQTLDPENSAFNVADAVELTGPVDIELLTRATHLAVTESDALTTRFVESPDGWAQQPGAFVLEPPSIVDLADGDTAAPDDALWSRLHAHLRRWTSRPHDLSVEPGVAQWILRSGDRTFWVLAAHHALIDAYGLSLVFSRGADLYRRLTAHDGTGEADLGRPLGRIGDVVSADLDYLDSEKRTVDAEFWAGQTTGALPAATGGLASAVRSARARVRPVDGDLTSQITAAVAALTARKTGASRVTLGFLLMNRLGLAAARVPTSAVNLVPLTIETGPAAQVSSIIAETAAHLRTLAARQRYRGGLIGSGATLTEGFARHTGTVVNVKPFATSLNFGGVPAIVHSLDRGPVDDYSVTVAVDPQGLLEVIVDADADRYDEAALAGLVAEIAAFIEEFTDPAATDRRLAALPLTSARQREAARVLGRGQENTAGSVSAAETFAASVAANPDHPAVVAPDETLTFAELAARADQIAAALIRQGVGPESFVAVVAEGSAAAVSAIIGIWRAGGAYVPIDPRYPADRIAHQLRDSAARIVLATEANLAVVGQALPEETVILDIAQVLAQSASSSSDARVPATYPHPESAAYAIYTSGSTGLPKGVVVSHRSLATLLASHRLLTMYRPAQRLLCTHTLSFDSSVGNLAWMCAGHALHLIDRADVTTADLVVDYVRQNRIDYIDAVPVLLDLYVKAGLTQPAPRRHVPDHLSTGGEAFPPPLWAELAERDDLTVFNLYGPTEACVDVGFGKVSDTPKPSIGVPSAGATLSVLDRHLQPVAPGAVGELYVDSAQLARGYHRQPGLTALRFVADPAGSGRRLYRTGDLVAWNAFGTLDYLGRADDQVQISGYRVEFGEVQALVERAAADLGFDIDQAVADVRTSSAGARRLVVYLTGGTDGDGSSSGDFSALRTAVQQIAPAHLVPAAFVPGPEIPLSPIGKTDRRALPDPWSERSVPAPADGDSPAAVLCGIIADLLDLPGIGPDDDFFSLGGDSIVAIQLTSRARQRGVTLTPRQVFELRTARELAEFAADAEPTSAPPVDPDRAFGEVPLTPLMRRVLRSGEIGTFAQARVLRVPAGVEAELLGEALTATVAAHPMLRAVFDGRTLTVPRPGDGRPPVCVVEHSLPEGLRDDEAAEAVVREAEAAARGIDLEHGPMISALLIRGLPAHEAADALVVVVHHLAVDGVSWRILTEDLQQAFEQASAARATLVTAEGTSFREWTQSLTERAGSAEIAATQAHWEHPGSGSGDVEVGRRTLDAALDTSVRVQRREVDVPAQSVISDLPRLYNTGPTEVLLATFAVAVGAVFAESGRSRLFVDLEGHGRDEALVPGAELSRTVGWFTAFWPVPVDLPAGPPDSWAADTGAIDSVIKQVKERLARPQYSGLEYGLLTELADGAQPQAAAPVLVNYLGRLTTGESHAGAPSAPFSSLWPQRPLLVVTDALPASHPLAVNAITVPTDDGAVLRTELSWVDGVLDADDVSAVVTVWKQILRILDEAASAGLLGGTTPSDSLVADLTQDEIDEFAGEFA